MLVLVSDPGRGNRQIHVDRLIHYHRTPSLPGEKLPNPGKIDEQQGEALAKMIGGHIKGIMNGVVADGKEGVDGLYEL